jgi:hypothetical protein
MESQTRCKAQRRALKRRSRLTVDVSNIRWLKELVPGHDAMPKIREAVMRLRVSSPAEFVGDVMGRSTHTQGTLA